LGIRSSFTLELSKMLVIDARLRVGPLDLGVRVFRAVFRALEKLGEAAFEEPLFRSRLG
jgi:hypothetical protein